MRTYALSASHRCACLAQIPTGSTATETVSDASEIGTLMHMTTVRTSVKTSTLAAAIVAITRACSDGTEGSRLFSGAPDT